MYIWRPFLTAFNRTIQELKYISGRNPCYATISFNRTIQELKFVDLYNDLING
ncbi:hypothetical protein BC792_13522 [Sphingobacterium allocomposti]|uniref:Uncharacterized protein n=1 Tax=Sphingobacterium allocomposti TaxID=415956 RepID=A0A5S5CXL2_9SPHI|nr:hypothetical protein BC792_13522 [Sphingobacterium composti Yoo et al. 2007 non Ten et al. 2007]